MAAPQSQWIGYWEQAAFGRQPMHGLELNFRDGEIDGRGLDVIGPFLFCGQYDASGAVVMVKQYLGQHQVLYRGTYDGEGTLTGEWSIGSLDRGPFRMRLMVAGAGGDEIQTLT